MYLHVGNYDDGIVVVKDEDDTLANAVVGDLAKKCVQVAARMAHAVLDGDAVLLYRPLAADNAAYHERIYGRAPTVFAPAALRSRPLSLLGSALDDPRLLAALRDAGQGRWRIAPFIHAASVYRLAKETGIPVDGAADELPQERIAELNDKAWFTRTCREHGIPTMPSSIACGWAELVRTATMLHGSCDVMVRLGRGAGGLGNCRIDDVALAATKTRSVEGVLEARFGELKGRDGVEYLVEPYLRDVVLSPSTLTRVRGGVPELVACTVQTIEDDRHVGTSIPGAIDRDALATVAFRAGLFARIVADLGGEGYHSVDWLVCRNGDVLAVECNFRQGGAVFPLVVGRRLRPGDQPLAVKSHDAHRADGVDLDMAVRALERADVHWDPRRKEGIVVYLPPALGSMGTVAVAGTPRRAAELDKTARRVLARFSGG